MMTIWLAVVLWVPVLIILTKSARTRVTLNGFQQVGVLAALVFYLVPALYVLGWVLLPSLGVAPHLDGI